MIKKKKTSADYGQFYFRITEENKIEIEDKIQSILILLEVVRDNDELQPKRNDLILRALKRGLNVIERELKK